jgi:LPS sulfotransferase NodH
VVEERRIALERDPRQLDELMRTGSSPNGVYGIKVMSHDFDYTLKSRWPTRLPNLHFIYLERRDILGQAISMVRALQTNQFRSHQPAETLPSYDGALLAGTIRRITINQCRWRQYFARNGITPLWLLYEEISLDPQRAAAEIARHIGLQEVPQVALSEIPLEVQRDLTSEEWRGRFIAEHGNANFLDHPFGTWRVYLRRIARHLVPRRLFGKNRPPENR